MRLAFKKPCLSKTCFRITVGGVGNPLLVEIGDADSGILSYVELFLFNFLFCCETTELGEFSVSENPES